MEKTDDDQALRLLRKRHTSPAPKFPIKPTAHRLNASVQESGAGSRTSYKTTLTIEATNETPNEHGKNATLTTGAATDDIGCT